MNRKAKKTGLIAFLKSKSFLIQLIMAGIIAFLLCFGLVKWLDIRTNHGQEIEVPDLTNLTITQAKVKLESLRLKYQINDTIHFDKTFLPNAIVEQAPKPKSKVKEGRTIYLKINAMHYEMVEIPDLKDKTFRQALPTLLALGLKEGKISYKSYFAEDVVLELRHKGEILEKGDKVMKTSKIDFVLGDGKGFFQEGTTSGYDQSEDNSFQIQTEENEIEYYDNDDDY